MPGTENRVFTICSQSMHVFVCGVDTFGGLSVWRSLHMSVNFTNRPFPSYLKPLFQSEAWCTTIHM